jgi:hypothetical protein
MTEGEAFIEMLVAAMKDAAVSKKLTQLQSVIDPEDGKGMRVVRIIVVPELMDRQFPKGLATEANEVVSRQVKATKN